MANVMHMKVAGLQRQAQVVRADRPCASHSEAAETACRRSRTGCAVPLPTARQSLPSAARLAARQGSIRTRAVSDAPATRDTSRMLVDLAVENLPLKFGAGLRAVGSTVELGDWNVDRAPNFEWSEGNNWHKQLELPAGEQEFKLVIIEDGKQWWESGDNRKAEVPAEEAEVEVRLELRCQYNQPQSMVSKAAASVPTSKSDSSTESSPARSSVVAQAAATEAPPKAEAGGQEPSFKETQKIKEDDGSITFSFPKGYRFRGGIEDSPPESDADTDSGEAVEVDEYEQGELVDVQDDPEQAKARQEIVDAYKPLYNDSQVKEMDEKYGEAVGPGGAVPFEMDKLGEGAQNEGWTMNDEYDAPTEEYGDDRADADKDEGGDEIDWLQADAGAPYDYSDPGDFYEGGEN